MNVLQETVLTFREAADVATSLGRPICHMGIYRWANDGLAGAGMLESAKKLNRRVTSREAVERFVRKLATERAPARA